MSRAPSDLKSHPSSLALPDDVVLSVRHVSKKFCRNLRRSMLYGMQDLGRNLLGLSPRDEAGNLKPEGGTRAENSDFKSHPSSLPCALRKDEFWALRDISFDLKRGEVLGLIGVNGSGKTTLLRMISGIFPPDEGEIVVRGRVGALIALGAGFHPHMTGRENIYLNAAILGVTRQQVSERFEEIVDFAHIGDFLDAPVAAYSSGMKVRLGFSIATCFQPELLLVDEVLAVGDAGFRAKCFSKIARCREKSAVILVTHNTDQIAQFCSAAMILQEGSAAFFGEVATGLDLYRRIIQCSEDISSGVMSKEEFVSVVDGIDASYEECSQSLRVSIAFLSDRPVDVCDTKIVLFDADGLPVCEYYSRLHGQSVAVRMGLNCLRVVIAPLCLRSGRYLVALALLRRSSASHIIWSYKQKAVDVRGVPTSSSAYAVAATVTML